MKICLSFLLLVSLMGCSTLNIFKGPDDYYQNHYADDLKGSIDRAILRETKQEPPSGHLTKPYSRELWDTYWNDRIYYIYSLGMDETPESYAGPSGKEFVQYIIDTRIKAGLPSINIEERNLEKVPKSRGRTR